MVGPVFGEALGANSGVVAYANRGAKNFKPQENFVDGVYTGFRYQCVEYARRWLIVARGICFREVMWASDIWDLEAFSEVRSDFPVQINKFLNGSIHPPKPGDVLIYNRAERLPWGHVAIITRVDLGKGQVQIAEQNEFDHFWKGDYSRKLKLELNEGKFVVEDKYPVIGWISY